MKISVCLATYNGEKYIKEQLDSILVQLSEDDEVIISDDGSKDRTLDIIRGLKDVRIKIFKNSLQKGYSKNFENAITISQGDIIFLADQDDVWMPNKVVLMLRKLEKVDIVISNAEIVDENLKAVHASHFELRSVKKGFFVNFLKTRYIGACMAFKRKILNKALPFPNNQKYCAHDYWLTLVTEFYYKVELEDTPLLKYRRHDLNASNGGGKSSKPIMERLLVRLYSFLNLLTRVVS